MSNEKVINLNSRRPLFKQFQMVANMLDHFPLEKYRRCKNIVEREKMVISFSKQMAAAITLDASLGNSLDDSFGDPQEIFEGPIRASLEVGLNNLFCVSAAQQSPSRVEKNLATTKSVIIEKLIERAHLRHLTV